MKKLNLFSFLFITAFAGAQNVGIGTNNPQTKLDINGALSARITSVAAAGSVTIPDNVTLFRLTNTTGGSTTNLTIANPKDGQFLSVINEDDNAATLNGLTIPAGTAAVPTVSNFINIGGVAAGWKTTGDNNTGANTFTAGSGLSWSGNTLNSVWTVNGQNDIYNNNSSGNVGIGNSAPGGLLDVSATAPANNSAGKSIILLAQSGGTGGAATNGGNVSIASGTGANGGTTGTVNINTGNTNTGAVNVANGTAAQTIGIANNNGGVKTVTIGSTNTTSATTINAGSGNVNLNGNTIITGTQTVSGLTTLNGGLTESGNAAINNNAAANTTSIGTGTTTGNVSIGGTSNNVLLPKLTTAGIVTNTATGQLGTTTTVPVGNLPDATTSAKGIVQLAGDLSGTATSPQIAAGVIVDADVNSAAAIGRSKLANGTANQVVINDGSGVLSSEAQLAVTRGGTGAATAAPHTFFGNNTGGTAAPGFQPIVAADLPDLSGTYVKNQTTQQASSNFNVSGAGVVGTTMTAATYLFPAPTGDPSPVITARTVPASQGAATERTELILFHGNDPANGSGDDLITLRAPSLRFQTFNDATVGDINNAAGSNDRMYIRYDGNIGIGTSAPTLKLDVVDATAANSVAVLRRGTQGSDAAMVTTFGAPYLKVGGVEYKVNSLQTIGFGWNSASIQPGEIGFLTTNIAGYTSGDLIFATRNGTTNVAPTEAMRITSLGNVGIGTSPATYKLEVNGGIRSADYGAAGSVNVLVGDDVFLSDMDEAHTLGIISASNNNLGRIRLGNLSNVVKVTDDQTGDFGGVASFDFDDADATTQGVLIEGGNSESGGFFANGNTAAIWSPGDGSGGILSVYDEDDPNISNPRFRIAGNGETEARYGLRTKKSYTYFRGRANEDQAYTYSLGAFDFCYLGGVSFYMDNNATWDIDNQCNVYPTDWGAGVWGDGGNSNQLYTTGPINYAYNTRPSWQLYVESFIDNDAVFCGAICVNFTY
ncbi:MAG: hypothetical protein KA149_00060 [Chitinophagales bacterium]|nr:hypothetical protein [Chitinophagales bacterium]